eukprot:SAG22_NODE_648_length_8185_cov_242.957828_3_plen_290_part_00
MVHERGDACQWRRQQDLASLSRPKAACLPPHAATKTRTAALQTPRQHKMRPSALARTRTHARAASRRPAAQPLLLQPAQPAALPVVAAPPPARRAISTGSRAQLMALRGEPTGRLESIGKGGAWTRQQLDHDGTGIRAAAAEMESIGKAADGPQAMGQAEGFSLGKQIAAGAAGFVGLLALGMFYYSPARTANAGLPHLKTQREKLQKGSAAPAGRRPVNNSSAPASAPKVSGTPEQLRQRVAAIERRQADLETRAAAVLPSDTVQLERLARDRTVLEARRRQVMEALK